MEVMHKVDGLGETKVAIPVVWILSLFYCFV